MASEQFSIMTKRPAFTPEQTEALKRHYHNGMDSLKEKEKIIACANETGLDTCQIHNFIGNFKRTVKGVTTSQAKKPVRMQGPSAFNLFLSETPRGSQDKATYFREGAEKWKHLSAEDRMSYTKKAEQVRSEPLSGKTRDEGINHHVKLICSSIEALEKLGVECGGISMDPQGTNKPPVVFGTNRSFQYFKLLVPDFETRIRGCDSLPTKETSEKSQLKTKVRSLYKDLWSTAAGKRERVPYGDILSSKTAITVTGLPDGVLFKDPSYYSKQQLVAIIRNSDRLSLKIDERNRQIPATITSEHNSETIPEESQEAETGTEQDKEETGMIQPLHSENMPLVTFETLELHSGQGLAEDIVDQIAQEPGLLDQVMTAEDTDAVQKVIELKKEVKEESTCQSNPAKRKKIGSSKNFTKKKKANKESYTVEHITDMEMREEKRFFKIKWLGCKDETWEPEENILDQSLIEQFLHKA